MRCSFLEKVVDCERVNGGRGGEARVGGLSMALAPVVVVGSVTGASVVTGATHA
jgi:hypothetical protein